MTLYRHINQINVPHNTGSDECKSQVSCTAVLSSQGSIWDPSEISGTKCLCNNGSVCCKWPTVKAEGWLQQSGCLNFPQSKKRDWRQQIEPTHRHFISIPVLSMTIWLSRAGKKYIYRTARVRHYCKMSNIVMYFICFCHQILFVTDWNIRGRKNIIWMFLNVSPLMYFTLKKKWLP